MTNGWLRMKTEFTGIAGKWQMARFPRRVICWPRRAGRTSFFQNVPHLEEPQCVRPDADAAVEQLPPEIAKLKELEALRAFFGSFACGCRIRWAAWMRTVDWIISIVCGRSGDLRAIFAVSRTVVHGAANSGKSTICELLMRSGDSHSMAD